MHSAAASGLTTPESREGTAEGPLAAQRLRNCETQESTGNQGARDLANAMVLQVIWGEKKKKKREAEESRRITLEGDNWERN